MLRGEKVYLRPIIQSDLPYLNAWKNDPLTYRYLGGGYQPVSIDQQAKWMDTLMDMNGSDRRFMISTHDGKLIGMVGLYHIHSIHRTAEVGLFIGNHEMKGKGYGKEACLLLENYAKLYLNLRKTKIKVVSANMDGRNIWESLGYTHVGTYSKERFVEGTYHDLYLMEKFL